MSEDKIVSNRLIVVGNAAVTVTTRVLEDLTSVLGVDDNSNVGFCDSLGGQSVSAVLADPKTAMAAATTSIRSADDDVVLVAGLTSTPAPSFDVLAWNLTLAANSGCAVVYALDGEGMNSSLINQEIATFEARAKEAHATVAGIVLSGARGVSIEDASVPVLQLPLSADGVGQLLPPDPAVVTPLAFQDDLLQRAAADRKRIVLPESEDDRILTAAAQLVAQKVADVILLGEPDTVRGRAQELGLDLSGASIVSTADSEASAKYAVELARLRAAKGMTLAQAEETVSNPNYFATMMVQMGDADGMVSGATHTTADTIRPAFQIIKTAPGVNLVSSAFLMLMSDRALVFADCAVQVSPTAPQLAQIALTSANTAKQFGIEPRIAMLSYSTKGSGTGPSVDLVTEAARDLSAQAPELKVEGPIQFDAAVDPVVGAQKAPGSEVAGQATVLIFPDLNAGNIAYKAIQRAAGAVAVGPILQGLAKPVNDLSRGALVEDIVNTVAITAVQAQAEGNK